MEPGVRFFKATHGAEVGHHLKTILLILEARGIAVSQQRLTELAIRNYSPDAAEAALRAADVESSVA